MFQDFNVEPILSPGFLIKTFYFENMSSLFIAQRHYRVFQLVVFLAFIAIWYLANDGLAFWDDYTYLRFANDVNQESFNITNNHFTSRLGMIYPVAWLIKIVGNSTYAAALYPLLCSLILLALIFWLGNRQGHWIGIVGALMILVDYHILTFSTHLFPEMPLALFVFGALICYDTVNKREGDYRLLALLMCLLLLAAFLIKTSIFICIPLFLFLFLNDLRQSKNKSFWIISSALLVFFFLLHGFWYQETFGDFWYRFNNISDNHQATEKTYFDKPSTEIFKRLTYLPLVGFTKGGFFIPLLFGAPAFLSLKRKDWSLNNSNNIWAISAILIIASWWFISTNWRYYSPMPTDTRHITFVIPLLIMAGAYWWIEKGIFKKLLQSQLKWVVVLALMAIPVYKITKAGDRSFKELSQVVNEQFVSDEQPQKIITDGLLSYGYSFFYDFKNTQDVYDWWVELDFESVRVGDYLLVNSGVLNDRYEEPGYLQLLKNSIAIKGLNLEELDANGKITLYRIVE